MIQAGEGARGSTYEAAFSILELTETARHIRIEGLVSPDNQARLDRLASESGRARDEFVRDAMPGYLDELERTREMLDTRYNDVKSGKVKLIPGDEAFARLRAKSEDRRQKPRINGATNPVKVLTDILYLPGVTMTEPRKDKLPTRRAFSAASPHRASQGIIAMSAMASSRGDRR